MSISCPTCGGNLKIESPAVKLAICEHCGATSLISGNRATLFEEEHIPLVDYPTRFEIGQKITIKEKRWIVQGYLDYRYEGGFWEEWWLVDDTGKEAWLQIDEGGASLLQETDNPFNDQLKTTLQQQTQVGKFYSWENIQVLITHIVKQEGKIAYAKGNFPYLIKPNQPISYVEGILWKDSKKPVLFCWEWDEQSESFTEGEYLSYHEIAIETKDSYAYEQPERFKKWALRCPNCGGSLEISNPHSQFCVCQYCGSTIKDPTGKLELFQASHGDKEIAKHFEFQLGETFHIGPYIFQVIGRNLWEINGEELWIEYDEEEGTEIGIDRYSLQYPEYNLYNPSVGLIRMYKDERKYYLYQKSLPITRFYQLFSLFKTWEEGQRQFFFHFEEDGLERGKGTLIYFDGESTYRKYIGQHYFFMDYLNKQTSEALLDSKGQITEVEFYNSRRCFPLSKEEYEEKKSKLPRFQPSFRKEWPIYLGLFIGLWFLIKGCTTTPILTETKFFEDQIPISQSTLIKSYPPIQITNQDSFFYDIQISFRPSSNSREPIGIMEAIISLNLPETDKMVYAIRLLYNPYAKAFIPIQRIEKNSITPINYKNGSSRFIRLPDIEQKFFYAPFALEENTPLQPRIQISVTDSSLIDGIVEWAIVQYHLNNSIRTTEQFSLPPSTHLMLGIVWSLTFLVIFIYRRSIYMKLKKRIAFNI